MTVAILLITHQGIGAALQATARQVMGGKLSVPVEVVDVPGDADPDAALVEARRRLARIGRAGVLVMTDMYGSTPANLAVSLAASPGDTGEVMVIAGVNLAMLVRALNYADLPLAEVADKALEGGLRSIFLASRPTVPTEH